MAALTEIKQQSVSEGKISLTLAYDEKAHGEVCFKTEFSVMGDGCCCRRLNCSDGLTLSSKIENVRNK